MAGTVAPARQVAFEVLRRTFEDGAYTDRAFRAQAERAKLAGRERAQAQRLAYGSVQRRGTTDFVVDRFTRRPSGELDPAVAAALRLGLYELLFSDGTPDHAAINEAVELTRIGGARKATGLVNAVLRRAVRERGRVDAWMKRRDGPSDMAIADSLPQWLAELWWNELGGEVAAAVAAATNEPAERALRINTDRWTMSEALSAASEAGVKLVPAAVNEMTGGEMTGRPADPLSLAEIAVVKGSWEVVETWVREGLATPQSRGSAAVVGLLDPQPGEHILDLCAGPGTKSAQIAARMDGRGELIAVEMDEGRARETADQLERLGVHLASVIEADAAEIELGGPEYDRVLVDAPCSDLGALNSRPDARWRKSPELIERVAELQGRILANAARHLRPGGTLVYSTCTISSAENEVQARRLLRACRDGEAGLPPLVADDLGRDYPKLALPADSRFLQIRPDRDHTTGFFIARFRYRDPSTA